MQPHKSKDIKDAIAVSMQVTPEERQINPILADDLFAEIYEIAPLIQIRQRHGAKSHAVGLFCCLKFLPPFLMPLGKCGNVLSFG